MLILQLSKECGISWIYFKVPFIVLKIKKSFFLSVREAMTLACLGITDKTNDFITVTHKIVISFVVFNLMGFTPILIGYIKILQLDWHESSNHNMSSLHSRKFSLESDTKPSYSLKININQISLLVLILRNC